MVVCGVNEITQVSTVLGLLQVLDKRGHPFQCEETWVVAPCLPCSPAALLAFEELLRAVSQVTQPSPERTSGSLTCNFTAFTVLRFLLSVLAQDRSCSPWPGRGEHDARAADHLES